MKIDFNTIPKFVINLDRRVDRLESITKELQYMNWTFERFSGIDMKSYVGCALSHVEVAKILLDKNIDYILVMEDDIFFMPYAKEVLSICEKELNNIEWDFFHFAPSIHRPLLLFNNNLLDLSNLPPKDEIKHRGIFGTSSFVLTKKSAEIIVNWDTNKYIQNSHRQIPIDEYFDKILYPNCKSYCASLPIVVQKNDFSDINHTFDNNHYTMTYNWNVYCPTKIDIKYYNQDYTIKERNEKQG